MNRYDIIRNNHSDNAMINESILGWILGTLALLAVFIGTAYFLANQLATTQAEYAEGMVSLQSAISDYRTKLQLVTVPGAGHTNLCSVLSSTMVRRGGETYEEWCVLDLGFSPADVTNHSNDSGLPDSGFLGIGGHDGFNELGCNIIKKLANNYEYIKGLLEHFYNQTKTSTGVVPNLDTIKGACKPIIEEIKTLHDTFDMKNSEDYLFFYHALRNK